MYDSEMLANKDKMRYLGLSGYTEYHASQIELMLLLGAKKANDSISFSMNNTIITVSGKRKVSEYVREKQMHAINLFRRVDFPADLEPLKTAVGILFNYFGLRSICELYSVDYIEDVDNEAFLKYISSFYFSALNSLMHGILNSEAIEKSINIYVNIVFAIICFYVWKGVFMKLVNGTEIYVKPYRQENAEEIANLIIRNFREVNVKDYGEKAIEEMVVTHNADWFKGVAQYANVYVFWAEEKIVGVGSISSFWGSLTESILLTIFVLPEFHGQGIGSYIIDTLEHDELFLRAERIEIPASITAVEFYRKKGYDYKNGIRELDDEQHYRLEKFRKSGIGSI